MPSVARNARGEWCVVIERFYPYEATGKTRIYEPIPCVPVEATLKQAVAAERRAGMLDAKQG